MREFYEQLKEGLGNLIVKELDQVLGFKHKIEEFQNHLLNIRKQELLQSINDLDRQLSAFDKKYTANLKVLDQGGGLKNLKQTYAAHQTKSDELLQLRSFLKRYDELEIDKLKLKSEKEIQIIELQSEISAARDVINSFEKTILDVHEFIQGSRKASFDIKPTSKKQIVEFLMRIDDDGSHSIDREKVFIYDFSLLINEFTSLKHPSLLIHDNIFEVDQDTLINSLKFIAQNLDLLETKQYILTLNFDRLESISEETWFTEVNKHVKVRFTKANRFLKFNYQETL